MVVWYTQTDATWTKKDDIMTSASGESSSHAANKYASATILHTVHAYVYSIKAFAYMSAPLL